MDPELIKKQIQAQVAQATAAIRAQLNSLQHTITPLIDAEKEIQSRFGVSTVDVLGGLHRATATANSQLTQPLDPVSIQLIKGVIAYTCHASLKATDAQTATNYTHFFVADRAYNVVAITEVHATAGTDAGSVTLQVEKLSGTTAPGSGKNMLSTAFNLKATANTPQYGTLVAPFGAGNSSASGSPTSIAKGDRIAWKTTGTLTALQSVLVTLVLIPT